MYQVWCGVANDEHRVRARFRPRRGLRVEVIRDYDFMRDLVAIRVTDGVMAMLMPFTGEFFDDFGENWLAGIALDEFDARWRRIIAERAPRMRAAYDRKRRARAARART